MRDWEAFVREHLDLPEMRGHREERMVSELAAHLEDVFEDALRRGVTGATEVPGPQWPIWVRGFVSHCGR